MRALLRFSVVRSGAVHPTEPGEKNLWWDLLAEVLEGSEVLVLGRSGLDTESWHRLGPPRGRWMAAPAEARFGRCPWCALIRPARGKEKGDQTAPYQAKDQILPAEQAAAKEGPGGRGGNLFHALSMPGRGGRRQRQLGKFPVSNSRHSDRRRLAACREDFTCPPPVCRSDGASSNAWVSSRAEARLMRRQTTTKVRSRVVTQRFSQPWSGLVPVTAGGRPVGAPRAGGRGSLASVRGGAGRAAGASGFLRKRCVGIAPPRLSNAPGGRSGRIARPLSRHDRV